jgi:hypothetical protein
MFNEYRLYVVWIGSPTPKHMGRGAVVDGRVNVQPPWLPLRYGRTELVNRWGFMHVYFVESKARFRHGETGAKTANCNEQTAHGQFWTASLQSCPSS